jgi:hypothetical protein
MATVCNAPGCGKPLPSATGNRPRLYCNSSCRGKAHAARQANPGAVATLPAQDTANSTLADVVRRDLEHADRLETVPGQLAVALAMRLVSSGTTASSLATLSKELRALMAEALAGTQPRDQDALDEFTRRLQQKAASA